MATAPPRGDSPPDQPQPRGRCSLLRTLIMSICLAVRIQISLLARLSRNGAGGAGEADSLNGTLSFLTITSGANVADRPMQRSSSSSGEANPPPAVVIGWAVSLLMCPSKLEEHVAGFVDSAAVLRHSIHVNSVRNPASGSAYDYKMYAIINSHCSHLVPAMERLGYEPLVRDPPINRNQIKNNPWLKKVIDSDGCCGSWEYLKLLSNELTDHLAVVHMDMDEVVLRPIDFVFDAMLQPANSQAGRAAREKVRSEMEFPNDDVVPDRIDVYITKDYTMSDPWREQAPTQGGFIVHRPNPAVIGEVRNIVYEGNYSQGRNNAAGWGGLGHGGKGPQGMWAYYYGHLHPENVVELNICRFNQVGADVVYRKEKPHGHLTGECKRYPRNGKIGPGMNRDCEDCRNAPLGRTYTLHYTACKKPWHCPTICPTDEIPYSKIDPVETNYTACLEALREWFRYRRRLDDALHRLTGDDRILGARGGEYKKDYFLGFCDDHKDYRSMIIPNKTRDGKEYTMDDIY